MERTLKCFKAVKHLKTVSSPGSRVFSAITPAVVLCPVTTWHLTTAWPRSQQLKTLEFLWNQSNDTTYIEIVIMDKKVRNQGNTVLHYHNLSFLFKCRDLIGLYFCFGGLLWSGRTLHHQTADCNNTHMMIKSRVNPPSVQCVLIDNLLLIARLVWSPWPGLCGARGQCQVCSGDPESARPGQKRQPPIRVPTVGQRSWFCLQAQHSESDLVPRALLRFSSGKGARRATLTHSDYSEQPALRNHGNC